MRLGARALGALAVVALSLAAASSLWRASPAPATSDARAPAEPSAAVPSRSEPRSATRRRSAERSLPPRWNVVGVVVTPTGAPIPDASVCLMVADDVERALCAQPDASGHFRLSAPRPPSVLLASAAGYGSERRRLDDRGAWRDDVHDELVITLAPSRSPGVDGRVADGLGGSVPGALVVARAPDGSTLVTTRSGDDGHFRLQGLSGPIELLAEAEAYSRASRRVVAPASEVQLVLVPAARVSGAVLSAATGEEVGGATVTAASSEGLPLAPIVAITGSDGGFALEGLGVGRYWVSARADGLLAQERSLTLVLGDDVELTLELAPAASLEASVRAAGQPCAGATLLLDGVLASSAVADSDGNVRLGSVAPGRYEARVQCDGALPLTEVLEVAAGGVTRRDWDLDPGLTLRGSVLRAGGGPYPDVRISALPVTPDLAEGAPEPAVPELRSSGECISDASGQFACSGLSAGEYEVGIAQEEQERSPRVRVSLSEGSEPVLLRAHESATIEIEIAGERVRDGLIVIATELATQRALQAKGGGRRYLLEEVRLGRYRVQLGASATPQVEIELLRDGEIARVELALPQERTIAGRVVDASGAPIGDAWVRASSDADLLRARSGVVEPVLTNARGEFVLPGLFDEDYRLTATSDRGDASPATARGGERDVTLRVPSYGSLSVNVLESGGAPVPAFSLSYAAAGGDPRALRGQHGRGEIAGLEPGAYSLTVHSDRGSARAAVQITPAAEPTELTLTVEP